MCDVQQSIECKVFFDLEAMCLQWGCKRRSVTGDQQTDNSWLQQHECEARE